MQKRINEKMRPEQFKAWLYENGLTNYLAGQLFGFSFKAVSAWNSGQNPVPMAVVIMMRIFDRDRALFAQELRRAEDELRQSEQKAAA